MKLFDLLLKEEKKLKNEENYQLLIDKDLNFDEKKLSTIRKFLGFCVDELGITDKFTCNLVYDRLKNEIKTTAYYIDDKKYICVYAKNRMLGDILRSVAHELTHQLQHQQGRIEYPVQDVGGEIEDEANATAGALIKSFIKKDELGENLFEQKLNN